MQERADDGPDADDEHRGRGDDNAPDTVGGADDDGTIDRGTGDS